MKQAAGDKEGNSSGPPLQGKDICQCGQDHLLQWFYDQGQGDEAWVTGLGSKASSFRE